MPSLQAEAQATSIATSQPAELPCEASVSTCTSTQAFSTTVVEQVAGTHSSSDAVRALNEIPSFVGSDEGGRRKVKGGPALKAYWRDGRMPTEAVLAVVFAPRSLAVEVCSDSEARAAREEEGVNLASFVCMLAIARIRPRMDLR